MSDASPKQEARDDAEDSPPARRDESAGEENRSPTLTKQMHANTEDKPSVERVEQLEQRVDDLEARLEALVRRTGHIMEVVEGGGLS